jgi:hypothetical protein
MTPYERVKLSRERTAGVFPFPNVLDCIRFAICEIAEYDDALLRAERTGDKRNNDKAHDPRGELGQALYMLLSAYVQWDESPDGYYFHPGKGEEWMVKTFYFGSMQELAKLADYVIALTDPIVPAHERENFDSTLGQADEAYNNIYSLAMFHGWPVDALIDDTCAKFEAKHAAHYTGQERA